MTTKFFKCPICRQPMKLIKMVDFAKIKCSRDKCTYELKFTTPEKTEQYFIDNGGRVEDGS